MSVRIKNIENQTNLDVGFLNPQRYGDSRLVPPGQSVPTDAGPPVESGPDSRALALVIPARSGKTALIWDYESQLHFCWENELATHTVLGKVSGGDSVTLIVGPDGKPGIWRWTSAEAEATSASAS
ncbi:hypothetical protein [Streptomyces heilongjiangensis]|uniref:Uncharacterized protein n=1 Tax=Streptomyces heilongjiangensis TaxID=945052 RepID=A0ABW1B301_9ACTN|nr:hypothetical protein [Streptomyces heilongjiangensis]MDC2950014.1 hypothetical protein [Streptomyces heilongjiangensis]